MNIYKQAIFENWTFPSSKGLLTVQQLCTLPLDSRNNVSLNEVAVNLYEATKANTISFVADVSAEGTVDAMKLELVKNIIATKKAIADAKQNEKAVKAHNDKIDELIAAKQDETLSSLSIEDLAKLKQ